MVKGHREPRWHDRSLAQLQRDAALRRVGRVRRWTIGAAAALTAGFAVVVSAVAPGRTQASQSRVQGTTTGASAAPVARSNRMPPLKSASELGLRAPDQAPQPAPDQSQAAPAPPAPDQSRAAPVPAPAQPQPAPAPAVVSGGS